MARCWQCAKCRAPTSKEPKPRTGLTLRQGRRAVAQQVSALAPTHSLKLRTTVVMRAWAPGRKASYRPTLYRSVRQGWSARVDGWNSAAPQGFSD